MQNSDDRTEALELMVRDYEKRCRYWEKKYGSQSCKVVFTTRDMMALLLLVLEAHAVTKEIQGVMFDVLKDNLTERD